MNYTSFLRGLTDEGRVTVSPYAPTLEDGDLNAGDAVLAEFDARYRLEWPADPPEFDPALARQAAIACYRACQFLIYRDLGPDVIDEELGTLPTDDSPSAHYSVDLCWRLLPDLMRLARGTSEDDPLVKHLKRWGQRWPLSSVGVRGIEQVHTAALLNHPGLRQAYLDRIFSRGDASRLSDPLVLELARNSLGLHLELAGPLAKAFEEPTTADPNPSP